MDLIRQPTDALVTQAHRLGELAFLDQIIELGLLEADRGLDSRQAQDAGEARGKGIDADVGLATSRTYTTNLSTQSRNVPFCPI